MLPISSTGAGDAGLGGSLLIMSEKAAKTRDRKITYTEPCPSDHGLANPGLGYPAYEVCGLPV